MPRVLVLATSAGILLFGLMIGAVLLLGRVLPTKQLLYISAPLTSSDLTLLDLYHRINVKLFSGATKPTWSQDGKQITFLISIDGNPPDLYGMDVFSRHVQPLIKNALIDSGISWSPDGLEMVFASIYDNSFGIYVMSVDCVDSFESCAKRLTPKDHYFYNSPTWSPDGKHIAFVTDKDDPLGTKNIYIMNRDGSALRRLTENPGDDDNPSWSPDSRYIVYSAGSIESSAKAEMMIIDTECKASIRCSHLVIEGAWNLMPEWSPDSNLIVFIDARGNSNEIYLTDTGGHYLQRLTNNNTDESSPRWRP